MQQLNFEAIGTSWQIDIFDSVTLAQLEFVDIQIQKRIHTFDQVYSRFRSDSVVTQMSKRSGEYILPADADKMISLYYQLYQLTNGLFTPLIGQTLSDAGYDANYSLLPKKLSSPQLWENVLSFSNPILIIKEPAILDFGAGGKGYLIDLVGEVLMANKVKSFCIDAGGDILCVADKEKKFEPIRIGLENPEDVKQVVGVVEVQNKSICGSAGNRRKWGDFHHIINPVTLSSPKHILATWVVADSTLLADALATALFFMEGENLKHHFDFEYAILYADSSAMRSDCFPGEFFIQS